MERVITATDANQRFSQMLRDVQGGESFVVLSRGRPVARVVPAGPADNQRSDMGRLLAYLEKQPRRSLQGWTRGDLYE